MTDSLGFSRARYLDHYRNDFAFFYADALRAAGHELLLYWPSREEAAVGRTTGGVTVRWLPVARWYWALWGRHEALKRTPPGRWLAEAAEALALLRPLTDALTEDGVDVLYVQEYWTGRFDVLAHRVDLPVVGADHGGRRRRQLTAFKARSFRRAALITSQSTEEAAEVRALGGEPALIPNGVDTAFFTPGDGGDQASGPSAIVVARLDDRQKRISDAIDAMAELGEEWRLDIVGTGPDEAALRARAAASTAGERIRFHGFVTGREALRERYRAATVALMPSRQEASTIALLEAMACGVPAVASSISAFDGFVTEGRTGARFPVGDARELAAALERARAAAPVLGPAARDLVVAEHSREALGRALAGALGEAAGT